MSAEVKQFPTDVAQFVQWWGWVPSKVARGAARKAFEKALTKTDFETILAGTRLWAADWRNKPKDELKYCPHPSTWLNREQWTDYDAPVAVPVVETEPIKPLMWDGLSFELKQQWESASEYLSSGEYGPVYRAWISKLKLTGQKDGQLLFKAPTAFVASYIRQNLQDVLERALNAKCEVSS